MMSLSKKIQKYILEAEASWETVYGLFSKIIQEKKLSVGVELGVASGNFAETILSIPTINKLYGVDPYQPLKDYHPHCDLSQAEFDLLYDHVLKRLSRFGDRYEHIRKHSWQAVDDVSGQVDFVYINVNHSYPGVWRDLCAWYAKVRREGIIGGHNYRHPDSPGVTQAVDEFFRRFEWEIQVEDGGVWWVEKQPLNVSFLMPAYNCAETVSESVESIMKGNFSPGDELVIIDDGSTDDTKAVLQKLKKKYPDEIRLLKHKRNKGPSAARNTAIEDCRHPLLFNLDTDNILAPDSVPKLKEFLERTGADVAYFLEIHFFTGNKEEVTHKWKYLERTTLADCLSGSNPGTTGNYMFTKESWLRADGYLEMRGALYDTWAFGFRQLATGSKMYGMPDSFYYHRHGHESYWVRDGGSRQKSVSLRATQIIIPFFDLLDDQDIDYIMGPEGRYTWFTNLHKRPIRLHSGSRKRDAIWEVQGLYNSPILRLIRSLKLRPKFERLKSWLKAREKFVQFVVAMLSAAIAFLFWLRFRYRYERNKRSKLSR